MKPTTQRKKKSKNVYLLPWGFKWVPYSLKRNVETGHSQISIANIQTREIQE